MKEKDCILVVDDDEGTRKSLTPLLKRKGFETEQAESGKEALAIAQGRAINLTLLDIKLPDIEGIQLLAPLKKTNPDMAIIMITGFASVESAVQALTAGASGYITKPIDLEEMLAKIKNALDHQHLVNEVRQAEGALKENETYLKTIFNSAQIGLIIIDPITHSIHDINPTVVRIVGKTRDELIGMTCHEFICPAERGKCPITDLRQNIDNSERILLKADGKRVPIIKTVVPIVIKGNTYLLESFVDITERKKAEDTIALANRKLALMNDVAYQDIQNKITALRGYSELSKDTKTKTERLAFIAKEEKILVDIHQLIKNTKQYQEMGLGKSQWVSIEPEIKMAAALTSLETTIPIDADLHELELYSDPLIGKVFFHLVDNAMKHGAGLTRITFSCHEVPDGLVLVCEDDGAGIDPSKRATLFSRITGDKARFGLFFVSEYLALAGMSVAETSEPGNGARFEITVPKGGYRFPMEGS